MKYKRRKPSSSKYVSETCGTAKKEARRRARLKKLSATAAALLVLFFCMARVGDFSYDNLPGFLSNPKIRSFAANATEFVKSKAEFVSELGKKGARFCFDYLRGEEEESEKVFAEKEYNESETDSSANSASEAEVITPQYVFAPSMPCAGAISSPYGERVHPLSGEGSFHNGIDIAANTGTEVAAIDSGIVEKSTYNQYSGNFIVIRHNDEYTSSYAHLSESRVSAGQQIDKGTVIGLVGSTGAATGPHLHMEIRKNGEPVNPQELIAN